MKNDGEPSHKMLVGQCSPLWKRKKILENCGKYYTIKRAQVYNPGQHGR